MRYTLGDLEVMALRTVQSLLVHPRCTVLRKGYDII